MKKHVNIPIFIPHLGCPNTCVFCNQRTISGVREFNISSVRDTIDASLKTLKTGQSAEIAFFGGSFTGIDRNLMIELLSIANEYIEGGRVHSIRCSTRPDYISAEILDILKKYNVSVIELGLQSISDRVLKASKRGHSSNDSIAACKMICECGFTLVGQMMIGLPGSTLQDEIETAKFIVNFGAEYARIYPTIVFHDTELCQMTREMSYFPLEISDAIARTAAVMRTFISGGVEVIRIGLCSSDNLLSDKTYFKGPYHSAFGELVIGEIYYEIILSELLKKVKKDTVAATVYIPKGELSKVIGQKRKNLIRLHEKFRKIKFSFIAKDELLQYQVTIECK
jgi:histone acetyltransferase (RNA polymerase elongator complex component)